MRLTCLLLLTFASVILVCLADSLSTLLAGFAAYLVTWSCLQMRQLGNEPADSATGIASGSQVRAVDIARLSLVSFALLALATGLLLALAGTENLDEIRSLLRHNYRPERQELAVGNGASIGIVAVVLVVASIAWPAGLFPAQFVNNRLLHTTAGPLAAATVIPGRCVALTVLWKLLLNLPGFEVHGQLTLSVLGAASVVAGGALAVGSKTLRGMAAHAWLLSGGAMLVALACGIADPEPSSGTSIGQFWPGRETAVLILVISSVALTGLLSGIECLGQTRDLCDTAGDTESDIAGTMSDPDSRRAADRRVFPDDLRGLSRQNGAVSLNLAVPLLTLCALPPLPGFWWLAGLAGNALRPGIESTDSMVLVPNTVLIVALVVVFAGLLYLTGRVVELLSLMAGHQPGRRFDRPALSLFLGTSACTLILAWIAVRPGSVLTVVAGLAAWF